VDPATEWEIQQSLNALLRGKTVLAVTHRLGTIVDADQIVVLDRDGRIEASGTHAQLLENSLTYARLWSDYSGAIDGSRPKARAPHDVAAFASRRRRRAVPARAGLFASAALVALVPLAGIAYVLVRAANGPPDRGTVVLFTFVSWVGRRAAAARGCRIRLLRSILDERAERATRGRRRASPLVPARTLAAIDPGRSWRR